MNTERMKEIQNKLGRLSREDFRRNGNMPYGEWDMSGEFKIEVFWEIFNELKSRMEEE